jgi:hypothetical protein
MEAYACKTMNKCQSLDRHLLTLHDWAISTSYEGLVLWEVVITRPFRGAREITRQVALGCTRIR